LASLACGSTASAGRIGRRFGLLAIEGVRVGFGRIVTIRSRG
jgi:hypothetical protein